MKSTWRIFNFGLAGFCGLLLAGGCVSQTKHKEALDTAQKYKDLYEGLFAYQNELESQVNDLKSRLSTAEASGVRGAASEDLEQLSQEYRSRLQSLENLYQGNGGESGDIEIFRTPEGEVYRLKDAVLFDSGSSEIKASGKQIINEIAKQISGLGKNIRVEGHTDSDPVVKSKAKFPLGNLQLSAERAVRVGYELTQAGIPSERISVAGFGPHHALAPNDSAENKRKNRRVEIVVLD